MGAAGGFGPGEDQRVRGGPEAAGRPQTCGEWECDQNGPEQSGLAFALQSGLVILSVPKALRVFFFWFFFGMMCFSRTVPLQRNGRSWSAPEIIATGTS